MNSKIRSHMFFVFFGFLIIANYFSTKLIMERRKEMFYLTTHSAHAFQAECIKVFVVRVSCWYSLFVCLSYCLFLFLFVLFVNDALNTFLIRLW